MFKGMVPPGLFQATCVSGAPPGPNRVLQGQQKQNEAHEKKELLYHKYIPRLPFESCSNCEVQHSYTPTSLQ